MNIIIGLFGRAKNEHKVVELARSYTTEAIDTLADNWQNSGNVKAN